MTETVAPPLRDGALAMRRATLASVSVALILIVIKALAWWLSGSVAMLSSLVDSGLDAAASLVTLLAVRQATTPADREHRFGHGKAEALASLMQAAIVAGSAVFLLLAGIDRLLHPRPISQGAVGIAVMTVSIALTFVLVLYQRRVHLATGSIAVAGDRLHYVGDLLSNAGVIVALVAAEQFGLTIVDPLVALAIVAILVKGAFDIAGNAFDMLMDRELPDDERTTIREIVLGHPEVRAMHDLRTRRSGLDTFIQLHLELDGAMPLSRAHVISDEVEDLLLAAFPDAEVIIHEDPAGIKEKRAHFARPAR